MVAQPGTPGEGTAQRQVETSAPRAIPIGARVGSLAPTTVLAGRVLTVVA
jgi:hypothetical protein